MSEVLKVEEVAEATEAQTQAAAEVQEVEVKENLTWKAKAEALSAELTALKAEREVLNTNFSALQEDILSYKAAASLGLTDEEGFDIAKMLYQKTTKEVTFKEWLSNSVNSSQIHKALTPYFAKQPEVVVEKQIQKQVKVPSPSEVSALPTEAERKALLQKYNSPGTTEAEKRRIIEQIKSFRK